MHTAVKFVFGQRSERSKDLEEESGGAVESDEARWGGQDATVPSCMLIPEGVFDGFKDF